MNGSVPTGGRCRHSRLHVTFMPLVACISLALVPRTGMATCYITGASPVAFGIVSGSGANTSGDVQFTCMSDSPGNTVTYSVCLYVDPNSGSPMGIDPRQMKQDWPVDYMEYNLYADPARSQVLGSTTSGHAVYSTVVTLAPGAAFNGRMTIYGNVPPQTVTSGNYVSRNTVWMRSPWSPGATAPDPASCAAAGNTGQAYLEVTATNADTCYISTATDMDFGAVVDLAGNRDQTSTISLHCPTSTSYQIALDYGINSGGGTTRRMLGPGSNTLTYELYRDPGRTQVWGATSSVDMHDGVGSGAVQTVTVYGRVPAQPVSSAGTYSDTVTVTLTF